MNGQEGDHHKGGKGGDGGNAGYAGEPGLVKSSVLSPREQDPAQHDGRYSKIEEYYPVDECHFDCVDGYIDPNTGLHTYVYNDDEGENFIPDIASVHFPTGKNLGAIDKTKYTFKST